MARTPKTQPAQTTALTNYEEAMAKLADAAANQEKNVGGGAFFSTRTGVLAVDGQSIQGNEMAVVIVDGILENVYYAGAFDADDIASPNCFAFGREEEDMSPHQVVVQNGTAESDVCSTCEKNKFGSAETGKGKACGNRRRLALLPAGTFDKRSGDFTPEMNVEHYAKSEVRYLKIPPTSIVAYANYVKQIKGGLNRPPCGVFTRIALQPHAKKQFEVTFQTLAPVPNELLGAILERNKMETTQIEFPYQVADPNAEPKKKEPVKTTGKKFTRG